MSDGHARREKPSRYAFSTRGVRFGADDACRGLLYTPDRPTDPPVVVLAPGVGLPWRPTLEATAERLADRGYAALAFDHRGFGNSGEGQLVSPARQRADLDAAIETARSAPEVDGNSLALWGMDLSAGTALAAAAESAAVDAVIARFPVVDGATLLPKWVSPRLRGLATGVVDYPLSVLGRLREVPAECRGKRVPLFGAADAVTAIGADGAATGARAAVGRDPGTTPARSLVKLQGHDVRGSVEELRSPILFVAGEHDSIAPPDAVTALTESVSAASLVQVPTDHYEPLSGGALERTLNHELAFLDTEL
ncbi:MAG: alpha/beta hydrolase [Halolamina sp.]|uniref:serine aminopeptidase domain-containing protein n=1 Tax=Halolamina sp. TaxID=1940283 RepID=UPI002FC378D5